MAYIGKEPANSFISFEKQVFTIVNSQTAYTLNNSVTNENDIRLVINNVIQEPGSGKAYTASGTTLTLSAALTNGTDEMYCVYLGRALQTVNAPSNSVGSSQVASTIITGQTAETSIATDDTVLIHDTSAGALRKMTRANFVSGVGGDMTPAFRARRGSNQSCSHNTSTIIIFDTEEWDTDSAYDNSNGRFTVPSGEGGKYLFAVNLRFNQATSNRNAVDLLINGSSGGTTAFESTGNQYSSTGGTVTYNLSAGDYVEAHYYQSSGGTIEVRNESFFTGFKLIGV